MKFLHFRAVFIADQRFLALKQPDKYWTLQIKYVQARDAGTYECQVSTEPKVSARVQLQVVGKSWPGTRTRPPTPTGEGLELSRVLGS